MTIFLPPNIWCWKRPRLAVIIFTLGSYKWGGCNELFGDEWATTKAMTLLRSFAFEIRLLCPVGIIYPHLARLASFICQYEIFALGYGFAYELSWVNWPVWCCSTYWSLKLDINFSIPKVFSLICHSGHRITTLQDVCFLIIWNAMFLYCP